MRPLFPLLLLIIAGIPSSGEDARPRLGPDAEMKAVPVALDPSNPQRRTVDALTYLGGVQLSSSDKAFGGFSAMDVEGDLFTLVSDGGNIVEFRMGADWRPTHIRFADLRLGPGGGWSKGSRDAESLAEDPATGQRWVGFEYSNSIWRYDRSLTHAEAHAYPVAMRDWDINGGAEAMVRLSRGGFIILSETSVLPGVEGSAALFFAGDPADPRTRTFAFGFRAPAGGFTPSDMAELPDGRVLVLTRRVSINRWFETKLVLLDPAKIRAGASVAGRELAAFTIPVNRDNFEALAVTRENGATILWIASDDNRELVQRSLLMKFRLDLPERQP